MFIFIRFFQIMFVVSLSSHALAQKIKTSNTICWHENINLKWVDFMGIPDTTAEFSGKSAVTATSVKSTAYWDQGLPNFRISHSFNKLKSWSLDTTSSLLLRHEQLHFDISELYSRKIRKGIEDLREKSVEDMAQYTNFIQNNMQEMNDCNEIYDDQTWNGSIEFRQKEWEEKITEQLNDLKEYKTTFADCDKRVRSH